MSRGHGVQSGAAAGASVMVGLALAAGRAKDDASLN